MLTALTGTPGTGKTSIASILKQNEITVLSLKEIAETHHFIESYDESRKSNIIDIDALESFIESNYSKEEKVLIEGHLSHELSCIHHVIVLRCHPKTLRSRLLLRNWPWEKIKENLEAESLDIILCEAIDRHGMQNTIEIDSTTISAKEIAEDIQLILQDKKGRLSMKPGSIDWSLSLFDPEIMEED
jgi:adenylate kinase